MFVGAKVSTTAAAQPRGGRGVAADECTDDNVAVADAKAKPGHRGQGESRSSLARAQEQSRPPGPRRRRAAGTATTINGTAAAAKARGAEAFVLCGGSFYAVGKPRAHFRRVRIRGGGGGHHHLHHRLSRNKNKSPGWGITPPLHSCAFAPQPPHGTQNPEALGGAPSARLPPHGSLLTPWGLKTAQGPPRHSRLQRVVLLGHSNGPWAARH